ncbi:MAG: esterase, partial [Pseudomonadota bacterium]
MPDIANDPRLDPRIKAALALLPSPTQETDVVSRDAQLAEANTPEAKAVAEQIRMVLEMADNEAVAP